MSDHAVDLVLAATLALLPLLPAGPQYLGLASTWWIEAAIVLLAALRLATPDRSARRLAPPGAVCETRLAWVLVPFALAVTGAALIGLAHDNPLRSHAFRDQLVEGWSRLFAPMNQSVDPLNPLREWLTLLEGPAVFLIVAAICRRAADPVRRARAALWGMLVGVLLVSVFAIVQYITRFDLHPHWVQANPNLVRSHSTLDDPNALGSYLVLGLGLSAALGFDSAYGASRAWPRRFALMAGVLAAGALVTSVSRAAWAAAGIAGLMVAAFGPSLVSGVDEGRRPRYQRWSRAAVGVCVVLLVLWMVSRVMLPHRWSDSPPATLLQVVTSTVDPRRPMAEVLKGREVLWLAGLRMAYHHPIVGIGLGRFARMAPDYNWGAAWHDNAHDFFLQALAETGLTGIAAVLLLAAAAWQAIRIAASVRAARVLAWGLLFSGMAFSLTLVTGHPLLLPSIQLVVGSMAASAMVASGALAPGPSWRREWRTALLLLTSTVIVVYGVAFYESAWDGVDLPWGWGYSWGLYDVETEPSGLSFRWTARAADLYSRIPPGADTVLLSFAALPADPGAMPTVTVRAEGQRFDVPCPSGDWRMVRLPLPRSALQRGTVEIRVDVDRVGVPSADGISRDSRTLGVRLQPLSWSGAAR